MLLRIAEKFARGTVQVEITGPIPEKLINLCMTHGIDLWGIGKRHEKIGASMYLADFFRIRPLVRKSQCRIRAVHFAGLPFIWKRIRRRKLFWSGAVIFFLLLHFLTSFVWFVDIIGTKTLAPERVLTLVREYGLRPGMPKSRLEPKQLEKQLLLAMPDLAWAGVSCQGTRVVIEVVEKALPGEDDKAPADIVAAKDGVIVEVIPLVGETAVARGNTVKRGDLLIKGIDSEQTTGEQTKPKAINAQPPHGQNGQVRAKGIVRARVWYEGYGEAALAETVWERTGRRLSFVTARVGSWEAVLNRKQTLSFADYEMEIIQKKFPNWRNHSLAVESTINVYHELSSRLITRSEAEARELAMKRALAAVRQYIPETAQILANDITVLSPEAELVRVKAQVETIEDIGASKRINP